MGYFYNSPRISEDAHERGSRHFPKPVRDELNKQSKSLKKSDLSKN